MAKAKRRRAAPKRTVREVPDVYVTGRATSHHIGLAFAQGCGAPNIYDDAVVRSRPIALFGGVYQWPVIQAAREDGRDWYYADHAYFGRYRYYRITRSAFQHDGAGTADSARFLRFNLPIRDWRKEGRHILICPPDRNFAALMGIDGQAWLDGVLDQLSVRTDRPIRIRDRHAKTPFHSDLANAWAVVTFMSNAAVEAVIAGFPVFCLGECAARAMGSADLDLIESPLYPEGREQWAANLAANQWTLEEIASGMAWETLRR